MKTYCHTRRLSFFLCVNYLDEIELLYVTNRKNLKNILTSNKNIAFIYTSDLEWIPNNTVAKTRRIKQK